MNLQAFFDRARQSAFHLWLLNRLLPQMIPFNRAHGITVTALSQFAVTLKLPYKKSNLNHIKGLHACALATTSEYATGLVLVSNLGFDNYRIIMQRLEMSYHYQGKTDAVATFSISNDWLEQSIIKPLDTVASVVIPCEIKTFDSNGNHLTTGHVHWQVKKWSSVRTKLGHV
jgi:acyl-coenzyme A thioesterase PaaI-like protein